MPELVNQTELSRLCGISPPEINKWAKTGKLRFNKDNKIEPKEGLVQIIQTLRNNRKAASDTKRLIEEETHRKLQLANDKESGVLVKWETIDAVLLKMGAAFCGLLQRKLLRDYPPLLSKLKTVPKIRAEMRKLNDQLIQAMQLEIPDEWKVSLQNKPKGSRKSS